MAFSCTCSARHNLGVQLGGHESSHCRLPAPAFCYPARLAERSRTYPLNYHYDTAVTNALCPLCYSLWSATDHRICRFGIVGTGIWRSRENGHFGLHDAALADRICLAIVGRETPWLAVAGSGWR